MSKNKSVIIKLIAHPYAWELYQARIDEAIVTGQDLTERMFWYENISRVGPLLP